MRPLDPVRSIKTKLGVLVAVTIAVASVLTNTGARLGLDPLVTIPATVAVALLVTQVLARGMTSPLREMTAAATAMSTGDYTRRVTATSRDEVGELARAFNRMATDLEAVDRQRRDLVANVSHELRTPVAALRALLENLADGVVRPDPDQLRAALDQTERLGHLVSDLLDLSRIDAGISTLDAQPVQVGQLLQEAVREAELAGRTVRFEVSVEPPDLVVHADRARLHQLVANLLDNASRHSPAQGTVRVQAQRDRRGMLLDVSDEGPGIDPAQRTAVFERFTTGTGADQHDGGTGLGLAIARWVTDLHGGSIEVADTATGCRIRACLPEGTPA